MYRTEYYTKRNISLFVTALMDLEGIVVSKKSDREILLLSGMRKEEQERKGKEEGKGKRREGKRKERKEKTKGKKRKGGKKKEGGQEGGVK